jgi:phosphomannomutase
MKGYMIGDMCLDKDGIRAAAVFAEMTLQYYNHNTTLIERLKLLQQKYESIHHSFNRILCC